MECELVVSRRELISQRAELEIVSGSKAGNYGRCPGCGMALRVDGLVGEHN